MTWLSVGGPCCLVEFMKENLREHRVTASVFMDEKYVIVRVMNNSSFCVSINEQVDLVG